MDWANKHVLETPCPCACGTINKETGDISLANSPRFVKQDTLYTDTQLEGQDLNRKILCGPPVFMLQVFHFYSILSSCCFKFLLFLGSSAL